MIGAHPGDENSALLAYFARARHVRTAYVVLNTAEAASPEQAVALGLVGAQELLAAHHTDGAEQFFTRVADFGFSKTAANIRAKRPREKVLGDESEHSIRKLKYMPVAAVLSRKFSITYVFCESPVQTLANIGGHGMKARTF